MRAAILALVLLTALGTPARADDAAVCKTRQVETAQKAAGFQGDARIKRLIDADLRRASKEESEGDADECIEALDHAAKLLAGDI